MAECNRICQAHKVDDDIYESISIAIVASYIANEKLDTFCSCRDKINTCVISCDSWQWISSDHRPFKEDKNSCHAIHKRPPPSL